MFGLGLEQLLPMALSQMAPIVANHIDDTPRVVIERVLLQGQKYIVLSSVDNDNKVSVHIVGRLLNKNKLDLVFADKAKEAACQFAQAMPEADYIFMKADFTHTPCLND